ncbi:MULTISPECIES: hypothetical protein [Burkholderia]|uniref:hypothetical protein n=1 Tax=Burkholderia TaxID=32008 RepID=UPI000398848D|nr:MULTISPECIES: hypothetical protein [Burkholderia]ERJ37691.1 hypothetical protein L810_7920 [Burkholderia sp. AU4i]MBA9948206.1 hypothetical protein [Burkholderia cepacia]MBA9978322.1 hypothetical protein [Burkholderia cepacia]MBA9996309.1 hypothetical protein [Burkholderia cepacia]MBB0004203.1 hypothetical protein [Burkholderia cepacia]
MDQSFPPAIATSPAYASPLVTRERFAELVGLPIGVITGFANRGYIPTVSIGKYSLVNLELLRKRCLDREFRD